ncbi:MAG: cobalbumin biosynthesis protein [Desulfovibrio sp.]|nr:MAG: cobalbumin biosynthesis protein [Desulfovibrio sp.]
MIRLVLGGERSGKSALGLDLLQQGPGPRAMVVTGQALDMEFRQRIQAHRLDRPAEIPVHEVRADLPQRIDHLLSSNTAAALLVDSLDFWLFHCLEHNPENLEQHTQSLVDVLSQVGNAHVTLVSCEVGLGPLAADKAARDFVREMGALNQMVAAVSQEVLLVVAGQPLQLKAAH